MNSLLLKTHQAFFLFAVLSLAACSSVPAGKPLRTLTFAHLQPIPINVGEIKTHNATEEIPGVFVISPYTAIQDYLHARFAPGGYDGTLEGVIEDAAVVHSYEQSTSGTGRFLNVGGFDVYDMNVNLRLSHLDRSGGMIMSTTINARRVVKVSEHASIAEREKRQFEGMKSLFTDLDNAVQHAVLGEMGLGYAVQRK